MPPDAPPHEGAGHGIPYAGGPPHHSGQLSYGIWSEHGPSSTFKQNFLNSAPLKLVETTH